MKREAVDTAIFEAYGEFDNFDPSIPEKTLLMAVLQNALYDLQKDGADAVKAAEYLLNPEEDYLFSFRSVCNYLNINPKDILRMVGLTPVQRPF